METISTPHLNFNDGHAIPQLGFGVFLVPPEEAAGAVSHALKTGYRSIDTAAMYRNEEGVGQAIAASGLPRDEVFVSTKLWPSNFERDRALRGFERSLRNLGDDHVDLYLLHWPAPALDRYVEAWEALCEIHADGRARSIGVSNLLPAHLERVIDATGVVPAVNQIELHPRLQQRELRSFHAEHGILTEAWSPLGRGTILDHPVVIGIASSLQRSPAQVVLRWHLQLGNVAIPKSVVPTRIEENFDVFGFELPDTDMDAIGALDDPGGRIGPDPATFTG